MKKYHTEYEVTIRTLSEKELVDYAPPVVSKQSEKSDIIPPKSENKEGQKKPRNSQSLSLVNEFLGVGGFSKVYKFKKDKEHKAIKKIMSNPKIYSAKLTIVDSIKREIFGMVKCASKHTIKVYDLIQNPTKDSFYILMELCDGNMEHLINKLGRYLNTMEVKEVLNQLNEVFYKLYSHNIIHRDIKPTNILYSIEKSNNNDDIINKDLPFNGQKLCFKLTDFGVCLPLYSNQYSISQFMGTLDFMAPEIYDKRSSIEQPMYTTKIDLFSLGQTILNLMGFIKKARPLDIKSINELRKENTLFNQGYEDQLLADLIFNNLLVAEPDDRANWELYFLHPFFEKREEKQNEENNI